MRLSALTRIMTLFFLCFSSASVVWDLITRQRTEINTGNILSLNEEKGGRNFKLLVYCVCRQLSVFFGKILGQARSHHYFKKKKKA